MIQKKFYDRKKNVWYDCNRLCLAIQIGNINAEQLEKLEVFLHGDEKEFFNIRNLTIELNEIHTELNRQYYKIK